MPKAPVLTINDLSPELREAAIQARCEADFPYWMQHYGVVEMRERGVVPMSDVVWKFQMSLAGLLQHEKRLIVLKARQIGMSTIAMLYA